MGLRRQRALLLMAGALVAAGAASCSAVLGLEAPTLDSCFNGCADVSVPSVDGSGSASGGDSTLPVEAQADAAAPDAYSPPDVSSDVIPDRGPSTGVRCGAGASTIFCADPSATCCLTFDDAGTPAYGCVSGAGACPGYPIACASDNDCSGSDVCCFYHSGIKCEPENTSSCAAVLVCDPTLPSSSNQCNTGQTCSVAWIIDGGALPYYGCN